MLSNREIGEALAKGADERFVERWGWDSIENTVGEVVQDFRELSKGQWE